MCLSSAIVALRDGSRASPYLVFNTGCKETHIWWPYVQQCAFWVPSQFAPPRIQVIEFPHITFARVESHRGKGVRCVCKIKAGETQRYSCNFLPLLCV